jgi:hypothetical protein
MMAPAWAQPTLLWSDGGARSGRAKPGFRWRRRADEQALDGRRGGDERIPERLTDADLAHIVDRSWTVRCLWASDLASVISDDLHHAGQAAFIVHVSEGDGFAHAGS